MTALVLDIETLPFPQETLLLNAPEFSAPSNYKDPAKIEAAIAEKRMAYIERAALDALTAQVAIAGFATVDIEGHSIEDQFTFALDPDKEAEVIGQALNLIRDYRLVTGFNIKGFDLPFLIRRAMLLGADCTGLRDCYRGRWSWNERFVDLAEVWSCGEHEFVSLETLSKAFGLGKIGKGADFPMLWRTDRNAAIAYNARDVEIESRLAMRLL